MERLFLNQHTYTQISSIVLVADSSIVSQTFLGLPEMIPIVSCLAQQVWQCYLQARFNEFLWGILDSSDKVCHDVTISCKLLQRRSDTSNFIYVDHVATAGLFIEFFFLQTQ